MFADLRRRKVERVLMTADCVGGVWTYAIEMIRFLRSEKIDVALATMGAPLSTSQLNEVRGFSHFQLYESRFPLEWMDDPWQGVTAAGEWLLNLEANLKPSIVHLNGYAHGALPWNGPVVIVGHSCVMSWWRAVKAERAPRKWARYRAHVTAGLRAADLVITPTRWMMASLEEFYGPLPNVLVIPNARFPNLYRSDVKQPYVLSIGRVWDEAKNFGLFAAASKGLPWPCYVAGAREIPGCSAPSAGGLNLLGNLDPNAIANWLARASIYAHPAKYEPFGLSVLEAALSSCPLVLADIGSLREIWDDAAWFFPPDDPEEFRAALETLIWDESLRREMAERAVRHARRYHPERMAAAYLGAYEQAMRHYEAGRTLSAEKIGA